MNQYRTIGIVVICLSIIIASFVWIGLSVSAQQSLVPKNPLIFPTSVAIVRPSDVPTGIPQERISQPIVSGNPPTYALVATIPVPIISGPVPTIIYSVDSQIVKEGTREQMTHQRFNITFSFDPRHEYALECPILDVNTDVVTYTLLPLGSQGGIRPCSSPGADPDIRVSRKERIEDVVYVPTYELKKKQLLKQHPEFTVQTEEAIMVDGVPGVHLIAGTDDHVYVVRDSYLYMFTPKILQSEYKVKFL